MKRSALCAGISCAFLLCGAIRGLGQAVTPPAPKVKFPFYVYSDKGSEKPGYDYAPSGWMGNTDAIELDNCSDENPHDGPCCIKVTFDDPNGWGGVVWQNPAENWGDEEGGLDLTGARQLTFWARGQKGGEQVEFSLGVIGPEKKFCDSVKLTLGKVRLTKIWKQYSIPVQGKNVSRIVTGFCFAVKGKGDPVVFYLDDIVYQ